uniref:Sulfotransferase n=1 Tax=Oryza punctata TaxID=4537 RepID=A0A0E0LH53_ORYPU
MVSLWYFTRKMLPEIQFLDISEATCEELVHDPINNVKKLAQFVGEPFSLDEEVAGVVMDIARL